MKLKCPKCGNTKEFSLYMKVGFGVCVEAGPEGEVDGEGAEQKFIERLLENINDMSPDIDDLVTCDNFKCEYTGSIEKEFEVK